MNEYHKIQTLFKRDMENNGKLLLEGQWTLPEFEFLAGNTCVFTEKVDGAKIQKGGGNYRADQDFVLFDVKVGDWWLQRADVEDVAHKLGLDVVPIIGEGTLHDAVAHAKAGIRSTWGDLEAEGIVARPKVELKTRGGQRLIAKIKCRDFAA